MVVLTETKNPRMKGKKKDPDLSKHGKNGQKALRAKFGIGKAGDEAYRLYMSKKAKKAWRARKRAEAAAHVEV